MQKVLSVLCLLVLVFCILFFSQQSEAKQKRTSFLHITIFQQLLQVHVFSVADQKTLGSNVPRQTAAPSPTISIQPTAAQPTTILKQPSPQPAASGASDTQSFILNAINAYRAANGLSPVQLHAEVCAFAATRAQEIVSSFNHDGFTNRTNAKSLPYSSWSSVTENIAMTSNYQDVVMMWENSPGHAENMRKDTPFVCVQQSGNYFAYEGMRP